MGIYLNPDSKGFEDLIQFGTYVDKSMLIEYTNQAIRTANKFICVSRPRRFGKSIAADMLTAYYKHDNDSYHIFSNLKIAKSNNFGTH